MKKARVERQNSKNWFKKNELSDSLASLYLKVAGLTRENQSLSKLLQFQKWFGRAETPDTLLGLRGSLACINQWIFGIVKCDTVAFCELVQITVQCQWICLYDIFACQPWCSPLNKLCQMAELNFESILSPCLSLGYNCQTSSQIISLC